MSEAPKQIWLHPAAMTIYVIPPETNTLVQYVRADLHARLQEQVETLTREKERFAELYAREAAAHMAYREASVAEQAKLLALLEGRDNFIVEQGLWPDFVWSLPAALQKEPQP